MFSAQLKKYNRFFRSLFVIAVVFSFGIFFIGDTNSSTDADGDGYASRDTGGNDCFDQKYAKFKQISGDATCNENNSPRYINLSLDIADHSWIKDDAGTWHLFFSMGSPTVIQHYTTTDLTNFTDAGVALSTTTDKFDLYGLWAPHVIKNASTYYMFYTGVTAAGSNAAHDERIGLATSSDLTNWTRVTDPGQCAGGLAGDGCILSCGAAWTMWGTNGSYTEACRDPMVIWDAANSRWVMVITTEFTNLREGISVAYSTDLINWTMAGYMGATTKVIGGTLGQITGNIAENPFITEYNGTYYLWFNDSSDTEDNIDTVPTSPRTMQQYLTSTTLVADASGSANWTYVGYTPLPGVNATEIIQPTDDVWIMSQSITNGNVGTEYWAAGGSRSLVWQRIVWNDDGTFGKSRLTNLDCRVPSSGINPGTTEKCGDGIDNDCSGEVDETSVCSAAATAVRGGSGPAPALAIGSGVNNTSIDMGKSADMGVIIPGGSNLLLYIGSQANFVLADDYRNHPQSHDLKITNLDMVVKKITITFESDPINIDLNLGETKQVDLNNDNINDVEVKFVNLLVNRIELTIKKITASAAVAIPFASRSATPPATPSIISKDFSFYRDLRRGMSGIDINKLQKFLNTNSFMIASTGAGSAGMETNYFGQATQAALIKFQQANGIKPSVGYFGLLTRKFIQSLK